MNDHNGATTVQTAEPEITVLSVLTKLTKDLKTASASLTKDEARFITDLYYQLQAGRIRAAGQIRAIEQKKDQGATHQTLSFFQTQFETLEKQMQYALGAYALNSKAGVWLNSLTGIGPVISAGIIANINIERAHHAGQLWKYAGICNPSVDKWEKGKKRPHNAAFKTLIVFKAGESFVKVQNNEKDVYGKLFAARKREYIQKNRQGAFVEAARAVLASKNIGKTTDAYKWYAGCLPAEILDDFSGLTTDQQQARIKKLQVEPGQGQPMLPPAHIHARARRFAAKIFLSHVHEVLFFQHYGVLPTLPYIIDVVGHSDYIPVPNLEHYPEMLEVYEKDDFRNRARIITMVDSELEDSELESPVELDIEIPVASLEETE